MAEGGWMDGGRKQEREGSRKGEKEGEKGVKQRGGGRRERRLSHEEAEKPANGETRASETDEEFATRIDKDTPKGVCSFVGPGICMCDETIMRIGVHMTCLGRKDMERARH
eukprot:6172804-Pleurochrysis_carterae.AAC.5